MFAVMCVVQSHGGTPIEGHQTPVQGLQRIVLQERMVLSHVAQVDRELQICKEKKEKFDYNSVYNSLYNSFQTPFTAVSDVQMKTKTFHFTFHIPSHSM